MKRKRRSYSKKKLERLEREIADRESKAPAESQARQERIRVLWDEITSGELSRDAKDLAENELVRSLVDLVQLQRLEITYLAQFRDDWEWMRRYYPDQLENLLSASFHAWVRAFAETLPKPAPKESYERKRRGYRRDGVGLIEYEFGGHGEAEWRKSSLSGLPYQPSCLDDILRGGVGKVKMQASFWGPPIAVDTVTNMRRLQDLFGMHRDRFPNKLRGRRMGREIVYDWCTVVKIMDALLSEKPSDRTRLARGRPMRLWLSDPALRARVLSEIEARVNSISPSKQIATAFLDLVRRHRVDSAKK